MKPILSYIYVVQKEKNFKKTVAEFRSQQKDIPMFINGKKLEQAIKLACTHHMTTSIIWSSYHKGR